MLLNKMVDFQTIASLVFLALLAVFLYLKRKNLETKQIIPNILYFSMYKTKLGLDLMDSLAGRLRKPFQYLGYFGIAVGFVGMILISYGLLNNIYLLFTKPEAQPGVGLVLPIKAKGVFFVPFFYWIISIFVIAVVHEFAHGLVARAHSLKVKSSGFAFLGSGFRGVGILIGVVSLFFIFKKNLEFHGIGSLIDFSSPYLWLVIGVILSALSYFKTLPLTGIPVIPAAFVEPDEKELKKRPHKEQLSVFAAGPMANIITAFACFAIFLLIGSAAVADGVRVTDYVKGKDPFPAEKANIKIGEVIQSIDGVETPYRDNLSTVLKSKKPGEIVNVKTDKSVYQLKLAANPDNESAAYVGAFLEQKIKLKFGAGGDFFVKIIVWLSGLFYFLFILNFGIGLFNLVPIGPLDGGRMLQLPLHRYFGKDKGGKIWAYIGMFFLIVILVNISFAFLR